jgi:hypothetical protein
VRSAKHAQGAVDGRADHLVVVAVGHATGAPLVLRWNGTSFTRETTPASSNPFLTGAAAAGPAGVWALGYRFDLNAYANRTLALLGT